MSTHVVAGMLTARIKPHTGSHLGVYAFDDAGVDMCVMNACMHMRLVMGML